MKKHTSDEGKNYEYDKKQDYFDFAVYDFDVDDDTLKPLHKKKLDESIKFLEDNYERRDRNTCL